MGLLAVGSYHTLFRGIREKAICGVGGGGYDTNVTYQRFIISVAVLLK